MKNNKCVIRFTDSDKCVYNCVKLPTGFYRLEYTFFYSTHTTFSSRIIIADIVEAPKLLRKIFQNFAFYFTNILNN